MKGFKHRILASALAVAMMFTSVPLTGITAQAAEKDQLITAADYVITSKSSGKVLSVAGKSKDAGAQLVQMTADNSASQVWTVVDGGNGYYQLVNKGSNLALDIPRASKEAGVVPEQHEQSNKDNQKFAITKTNDGYYRISPKLVSDFALNVYGNSKSNNAKVVQWKYDGADNEKWSFKLVKSANHINDYDKVARQAYDAWLDKFFYVDEKGFGRLNNMNGFWTEAEVLEMFVDAYEHFGDQKYLTAAEQLYDGLMDKRNVKWTWNGYTDDVMYMIIATVRLYMVSHDPRHLNTAKGNFDWAYGRAVKEDGALIWCMDEDKQYKNAVANCPGMIAAVLMGKATGDTSYFDKAEKIWDYTYPNLFEKQYQKSGGYDDTGIQGIFIGSNALLYEVTGKEKYKQIGIRACEIAKSIGKGSNKILNGEGVKGGDYNSVAAKGILARWIGYFTEVCPDVDQFDYWMEMNADSAWSNRNSEDIMWGLFGTQTEEHPELNEEYYESKDNVQKKRYASWACSAAVSWLINCTGRPIRGTGAENATKIEAEKAKISGGAKVVNASGCSNGKYVGDLGVNNGSVQFTFKSDDNGKALVSLYYASKEARQFNVTVNDKKSYTVDAPATSAWNKTGGPVVLTVDFVKGNNKVVVSGVDGKPAPNLDYAGVNLPDRVEMEDGLQEAGARDANNDSCSGGKDMQYLGGSNGGTVKFTVLTEAAGKAKLTFTYATSGARKVNVLVNGKSHQLDCKNTGSWAKYNQDPLTVDINLNKGSNIIVFTGVNGATGPNLDWYKIEWPYNTAKQTSGSKTFTFNGNKAVYEAEDAALKNGAQVVDKNVASNGQKVGDIGGADNGTCTFTINSTVAGNANIDVYYLTNEDRAFYVSPNASPFFRLPCEGDDWNEVRKTTMSVYLKVGENTIKFDNGSSKYAPDLDRIEVSLVKGNPTTFTGTKMVLEAENAALKNGAVVVERDFASNGAKVGELGGTTNNGICTFTFNSTVAGKATVDVYYITNEKRSFYVTANDGNANELVCEGNNWDTVRKTTITVNVNAGTNTLKFDNGAKSFAPDLDKIEVALVQ